MELTAKEDHPAIGRIRERLVQMGAGDEGTVSHREPEPLHGLRQFVEGVLARGIEFKGRPDEVSTIGIDVDRLGFRIVQIADRGEAGPDAIRDFLTNASLDIF